MSIQSVNPATGETLETFEETSPQELERSLAAAAAAFHEWRGVAFATRAQKMREAARVLRARAGDYARTMTLEMGKPIVQAEAEIDKCAVACEYYADHAEAMLAPQPRQMWASSRTAAPRPLAGLERLACRGPPECLAEPESPLVRRRRAWSQSQIGL